MSPPHLPGLSFRLATTADADVDVIHALNQASVPAVGTADRAHIVRLLEMASLTWIVGLSEAQDAPAHVAGFVMLFTPGAPYESPNYRWFCERYASFLYVDRVVVAEGLRGRRIGETLYTAAKDEARRRGATHLLAEVNTAPANPGSSRFHRRMGFVAVGEIVSSVDKAVEMLAAEV